MLYWSAGLQILLQPDSSGHSRNCSFSTSTLALFLMSGGSCLGNFHSVSGWKSIIFPNWNDWPLLVSRGNYNQAVEVWDLLFKFLHFGRQYYFSCSKPSVVHPIIKNTESLPVNICQILGQVTVQNSHDLLYPWPLSAISWHVTLL